MCISEGDFMVVSGAYNLVFNIAVFVLPLYATSRLQISGKQKLGIGAYFAIGLM